MAQNEQTTEEHSMLGAVVQATIELQSLTARLPLLTETIAFGLGRRCWSSPKLIVIVLCLTATVLGYY